MTDNRAKILAEWDANARVWFAHSYDIRGLSASAPDRDTLISKLQDVVPALAEANDLAYDRAVVEWIEEQALEAVA